MTRNTGNVVTLYDVARLARVSTATVSRVVHGQDRVRPSTRERVTQVIEELGYVPDGAAQSLSRRRKDIIGLVCVERRAKQYDIENMNLLFYDEILRGVESRIRDCPSWSLLITYLQAEQEDAYSRLQSLQAKVDGLLIAEGVVGSPQLARLNERIPVVVIAGDPGERAADVVTSDNWSGSVALVSHLISEHGRRRFFYVDGPPGVSDAAQRRLAFEHVLRGHPECQLTGSYPGLFSVQSGEEAGASLVAVTRDDPPDAIVCGNDQMAIGVLQALARHDIAVPQDVAVVGFDDIYPGSISHPPLTTVHQPMGRLGERACARLLDRIGQPAGRRTVELLETELVLRSSCGCPPGASSRRPVQPVEQPAPAPAALPAARPRALAARAGRQSPDLTPARLTARPPDSAPALLPVPTATAASTAAAASAISPTPS
jgi:LacI family transcriptional regulator